MMNNLEDILVILQGEKKRIFGFYSISFLAVLESNLSDEPIPTAGLGIVVEFDGDIKSHFIELQNHLSDLLKRPIHLIVKKGMSKEIVDRMRSEMHII